MKKVSDEIFVATAGNVLPSALAVLRQLGFSVSFVDGSTGAGQLLEAAKPGCRVRAEDPVLLLGLVKLIEERGAMWKPTDAEVEELIKLEAQGHG